ncbi:Protein flightless-1 like protein [Aquirufa nivalisilvae]|uniref:non-specific serine/threonine protein kinase n=1 Tax=Aquirufa nivalisilvae TaxID=2516557 RepID=A0A2S2DTU6_9BACT|nr:COR domain-containing protein [Aquirufa nivalisilvae]AWL08821.1 Protein flightless-1 like protein [Aquirufa nivalisilvae]
MTIEDKISNALKNVITHGWNRLDLKNCGLSEIPEIIFENCPDLVIIDLSNDDFSETKNQITKIPKSIKKLKKLTRLNLSNNLISEISEDLSELSNLVYLNLSNNKITHLPSKVANLPKLTSLFLEGNPFDLLPPEIVARGVDSIRNFIQQMDVPEYLYEAKLVIVGEGRVGKTCLSKGLMDDEYELEDEISTEGINIQQWIIPEDQVKSINPSIQRDLQINVWDFGGQEIYHSTHQFFLTKRSIYMIVTESRKEDRHEDFYYWLNIIKLLGDQSPIIMVLNKADQTNKEIPFKEFQESFPNLKKLFKVSLKQEYRLDFISFKNELIEITSQLPHIGTPLPKVWVDIRFEIEKLKQSNLNYINQAQYLDICKMHYRDHDAALFLSEYFHDLGVILHFQNDFELKDTIFLNHEWVTKGVYKILDDKTVIEQKGRFSLADINRIWSDHDYREKMPQLLCLMRNKKFDLCFELENGDYLVPRLLPVDEIDIEWIPENELIMFELRYKFMPKGILSRLIVKMHRDIYDNKYWRYGVLLKYENTYALIREKYFESKITILLSGDNKKDFLAIIRKNLLEINKDFQRLKVDEMIHCNCDECYSSENPFFYSYDLLRRCEATNIQKVMCHHSLTMVFVSSLVTDISRDRLSEEKIIYCENKNSQYLNDLELANVSFISEKDASGVFSQTKASIGKYGLRDRDFLLDSEIIRLRSKYPNYYILNYYCFENYLYHPSNVAELGINNLSISEYTTEITRQKNQNKNHIISIYKQARSSYYELKIATEKIIDKPNENEIIEYLNSDNIEIFFKAFSTKDHLNKDFIDKYGIKPKELASTEWFKKQILEIIDPK